MDNNKELKNIKDYKKGETRTLAILGYSHLIITEEGRIYNTSKNIWGPSFKRASSPIFFYSVGFYIHQLLALAFIENPKKYKYVKCLDGNCDNIKINNLSWCKEETESIDFIEEIKKTIQKQSKHINSSIGEIIKILTETSLTIKTISKKLNINISFIWAIYHKLIYPELTDKMNFHPRVRFKISNQKINLIADHLANYTDELYFVAIRFRVHLDSVCQIYNRYQETSYTKTLKFHSNISRMK